MLNCIELINVYIVFRLIHKIKASISLFICVFYSYKLNKIHLFGVYNKKYLVIVCDINKKIIYLLRIKRNNTKKDLK